MAYILVERGLPFFDDGLSGAVARGLGKVRVTDRAMFTFPTVDVCSMASQKPW